MKVGQKVKIIVSHSGPDGTFTGSTPWKDEILVITEKNINAVENMLRAGFAKLVEEEIETVSVLPDSPKIGKRSRKVNLQPKDEQTA